MIRALLLLVAVSLASLASAQSSRANRPFLRVGTWNIEHFGQRKDPARQPESFAKIAAFIKEKDFAVLALQEIRDAATLRKLRAELGESWDFVIGTTGGFRESADAIRLAFLWNARHVELLHAEELRHFKTEVDGVPVFHRVPITGCFRARSSGLDFRLVTCHLKASRGERNEQKRRLEMQQLVDYFGTLQKDPAEDQDIFLLGDFNHTYGDPAYRVFENAKIGTYLRGPKNHPTIVWFDNPIDHIVALNGTRDEVMPGSHFVHGITMERDKDAWRAVYSDHVPVAVQLYSDVDRDPAARFRQPAKEHRLLPGAPVATTHPVAAGTKPSPRGETPSGIGPGMRVMVRVISGTTISGILVAPLTEWIHLRGKDGKAIAIPVRNVTSIHEL